MPRDGALTFSDLAGRLDVLRVHCERCDLHGRYSVAKLTADYGRDGRLVEWFGNLTRDCALKRQRELVRACDAIMPDLPRVWLTPSDESGSVIGTTLIAFALNQVSLGSQVQDY